MRTPDLLTEFIESGPAPKERRVKRIVVTDRIAVAVADDGTIWSIDGDVGGKSPQFFVWERWPDLPQDDK